MADRWPESGREGGEMTPADKEIVAEYMGWFKRIYFYKYDEPIYFQEGVAGDIVFDLNDAGLCVEKMRNTPSDEFISDWHDFFYFACPANVVTAQVTEFFMNADNFFTAMAAWLRREK
jgi:hypothetical protein